MPLEIEEPTVSAPKEVCGPVVFFARCLLIIQLSVSKASALYSYWAEAFGGWIGRLPCKLELAFQWMLLHGQDPKALPKVQEIFCKIFFRLQWSPLLLWSVSLHVFEKFSLFLEGFWRCSRKRNGMSACTILILLREAL